MPNKEIKNSTIKCRGRNGWFNLGQYTVSTLDNINEPGKTSYVLIRSKTFGKNAPIQFVGPPSEIKKFLKNIIDHIK